MNSVVPRSMMSGASHVDKTNLGVATILRANQTSSPCAMVEGCLLCPNNLVTGARTVQDTVYEIEVSRTIRIHALSLREEVLG